MLRFMIKALYYGQPLLALGWLLGVAMRDRWRMTIPFHYIAPVVVVALGLAWLLFFHRRRSPLGWLVGALTCAALLRIGTVDFSWRDRRDTVPDRSIRVVHWNMARGLFGADAILPVLQADQADIYVLSEFPGHPDFYRLPAQLVPGGKVHTGYDMVISSRFPFEVLDRLKIPGAPGWCVRIATRYGVLDLLAIDLVSDPHRLRRGRMKKVTDWVSAHDKSVPLLIVGDFNTPRDSIYFEGMRNHVFHAYEKAGRCWPYTWPVPFPLYAIDHAWVSPRVQIYNYQLAGSRYSDHRRQILDILPIPRR